MTRAKISAGELTDLCDRTRDAIVSLRSCRPNEIANEARILRNTLNDLCAPDLARKNSRATERRRDMIRYGNEALVSRTAQLGIAISFDDEHNS